VSLSQACSEMSHEPRSLSASHGPTSGMYSRWLPRVSSLDAAVITDAPYDAPNTSAPVTKIGALYESSTISYSGSGVITVVVTGGGGSSTGCAGGLTITVGACVVTGCGPGSVAASGGGGGGTGSAGCARALANGSDAPSSAVSMTRRV